MKVMLPTVAVLTFLGMVMADLLLARISGLLAAAGVVGVALVAFFAITRLPGEALAWQKGARGERRTAAGLQPLQDRDFIVFHDRAIPGGRGNIDHVAIGPQGVFVIETKYWSGDLMVTKDKLFVNDRDRRDVITQMYDVAVATQIALGERMNALRLTVTPILCVQGSRLPMFDDVVAGVRLCTPRELRRLARAPALLTPQDVQSLADLANERLLPKY